MPAKHTPVNHLCKRGQRRTKLSNDSKHSLINK
jgi:hypothetical protein